MKSLVLLTVLSLSLASIVTKPNYSQFILGVLQGTDMISYTEARHCDFNPSETQINKKLSTPWEKFIDDLLETSYACNFEDAIQVLSAFRADDFLMTKTSEKYEQAKRENKFKLSTNLFKNGNHIGEWLFDHLRLATKHHFHFDYDSRKITELEGKPLPVAIFHGLGHSCAEEGMVNFTQYLGEQLGTYTRCVEIGTGSFSSYVMSLTEQVNEACNKIKSDSNYAAGLNVVGFSQGGIIARGVFQKCSGLSIQVVNTVGSPNMGVDKIPNCEIGFSCKVYNSAATLGGYTSAFQATGPGGYYKDQYRYDTYLQKSSFLADLNNERSVNQNYIDSYLSLDWFVQVYFTEDTVCVPKQSEWFYYFQNGSNVMLTYNQTSDYINDVLGQKTLDSQGKIIRVSIDANHLLITQEQYTEYVVPYLL